MRIQVLVSLALGASACLLAACGAPPPAGPDVRGMALPDAEKALKKAHIGYSVHSEELLGVIIPQNWTVCDEAGINSHYVRLDVKHNC